MKTNKINTTRVYEIQMANKWQFDGITIAHHLVSYSDHSLYSSTRNDELVRLHFGLKGDYRFTCHEFQKSFDLIGRSLTDEVKPCCHTVSG